MWWVWGQKLDPHPGPPSTKEGTRPTCASGKKTHQQWGEEDRQSPIPTPWRRPQPTRLQPHADGTAPPRRPSTTRSPDLLRHVDENVLCAILGCDEPVALGARELLADALEDGAGGGTCRAAGGKGQRCPTSGTHPGGSTGRGLL